jgi:hypothetical protein
LLLQFQGAISDFHPIKESIKAADYDPLLIRLNEDDAYGDGNNFEVAVTQVWASTKHQPEIISDSRQCLPV